MRKIPKIIHQTYPSKDLPERLSGAAKRLQELNPEWDYRFYDDADCENFIRTEYGANYLALYHRIGASYGAARADFFRYLLMYKYGGAYFDMKSACTIPLDDLIGANDEFFLSHWSDPISGRFKEIKELEMGEYQQWYIISAPGHYFLKSVIERVVKNIQNYSPYRIGVSKSAVLKTTGPIAYTQAIHPILSQGVYRHGPCDVDFSLVYSVFESHSTHHGIYGFNYGKSKDFVIRPKHLFQHLAWLPYAAYLRVRPQYLSLKNRIRPKKPR